LAADSKEVTMTYEERTRIQGETLAQWAEGWNGAKPIPNQPGRFGKLTNPDKKWDWWQVGGRPAGH
jgi:hypothetical protein